MPYDWLVNLSVALVNNKMICNSYCTLYSICNVMPNLNAMCRVVLRLVLFSMFASVLSVEVRRDEKVRWLRFPNCVMFSFVSYLVLFLKLKWPPKRLLDWFRPAAAECREKTGVSEGLPSFLWPFFVNYSKWCFSKVKVRFGFLLQKRFKSLIGVKYMRTMCWSATCYAYSRCSNSSAAKAIYS